MSPCGLGCNAQKTMNQSEPEPRPFISFLRVQKKACVSQAVPEKWFNPGIKRGQKLFFFRLVTVESEIVCCSFCVNAPLLWHQVDVCPGEHERLNRSTCVSSYFLSALWPPQEGRAKSHGAKMLSHPSKTFDYIRAEQLVSTGSC